MAGNHNAHGWTWVFGKNKNPQSKPIVNPFVKDVEKIAMSFFVTNFPESLDAKNLWKEFQRFGRIVDAFIANKRSKTGKRFGFVRFLGVRNGEDFAKTMSNIWIGSYHLFVSISKFERTSKTDTKYVPKFNVPQAPPSNGNKGPSLFPARQSYASVANGGGASKGVSDRGSQDTSNCLSLSDNDLIKVEDTSTVLLAKVKEVDSISNMYGICRNEGFTDVSIHYVGGLWVWIQFENSKSCEAFKENESLKSFWTIIRYVSPSFTVDERLIWIEIRGLPLCAWGSNAIKKVTSLFGKFKFFDSDSENTMSHYSWEPDEKDGEAESHTLNKEENPMGTLDDFVEQVVEEKENHTLQMRALMLKLRHQMVNLQVLKMLMIEVGDALGYDVKGCKRSLRKMLNGIGASANHQGNFILFGDLNEVRCETERFGSNFSSSDAAIFNAFIQDVGLIDLPMGGKMFTWMNKSGSKLSKLDRFLISNNVLLALLKLQVTVLDRVWSDHNPILLHCQNNDFGPTPFKVYHSWFERCDFDNVVKETWNSLAANDDGLSLPLHEIVKGLKLHLKTWVSQTKDNETSRKKSILALLKSLDEKIDAGQASEDDRMLRVNSWHELDNLEKLVSMDLIQKAQIRWDVEGDENSKFFHSIINSKRKSQPIQGILQEGVWVFDPGAIKMAFLEFYKEKFSCHDSPVILPSMSSAKSLSDSDRHLLDSMVSLEEIKNAVWDCGSQKAPGPDGFSFMFVKKYWDIMKIDIQNFVMRFFSSSSFPPGTNSSFFTLIPKVSNPLYIKDFRPISLIGFQYKIVAKILANRLSKVMDSIISHEQSAFISGRQILDGPLILSEVIECWRFLDHVMERLGFSSTWRKWIMAGLKSSRASILVNGSPTSEFSLKRGLRQGDPLSPFLFIIVMEGLHIALKDGLTGNLFQGVKIGSSEIRLSHLFYADDVIILSEWNQCDMDNIIRILMSFYLASGLKINISKSNLYGVGVSSNDIESMAAGTGCSASNLPFSYLGLPIGSNMNRIANWNSLIERFKIRLSGWKANMLSSGGRLTLIKSVLGSLGIYYFSIFKVPEAVLKTLESLRASFFWGATGDSRKLAWIKWSNILASLDKGGLGVLKSIHGNEAGIELKGCQTNGLWARIVGTIYHLHSSGYVPLNSLRYQVGDGSMIRFWKDTWLGDAPLCSRFNRLFRLEKNQNCLVRDRIVNGLWAWDWRSSCKTMGRALEDLNNFSWIWFVGREVDREWVVLPLFY
ncbi:putative RNA-directed DNA polymerase, eukaryota, reverse transcriptase zinc-binding domain protein [Tanacetum coccineum]